MTRLGKTKVRPQEAFKQGDHYGLVVRWGLRRFFLLWLHELSTVEVLTVFPTLSFLVNIINRDKHDQTYDHPKYVNIFLGQMLYCELDCSVPPQGSQC